MYIMCIKCLVLEKWHFFSSKLINNDLVTYSTSNKKNDQIENGNLKA